MTIDKQRASYLRASIIGFAVAAIFGAMLIWSGCATTPDIPDGYQDDTTPTHNGEEWVGGQ